MYYLKPLSIESAEISISLIHDVLKNIILVPATVIRNGNSLSNFSKHYMPETLDSVEGQRKPKHENTTQNNSSHSHIIFVYLSSAKIFITFIIKKMLNHDRFCDSFIKYAHVQKVYLQS
jgi:hypothetical protein